MVRSNATATAPGRPRCGLLGHASMVMLTCLSDYAALYEVNLLL
jgi:hypothetical protein